MQLLAVGHKRTGACPTFEQPVLQRDGLLVRVPLVGGALTAAQAAVVAEVSATRGSGVIELTNRGNLQLRGVREAGAPAALATLRSAGLGGRDAALVTISPFAKEPEHQARSQLLATLDAALVTGPPLAPKFAVHVDDADGRTAGRRAEVVLVATGGAWSVGVAGVGRQVAGLDDAVAAVVALVDACRAVGPQARTADVLALLGVAGVREALPLPAGRWEALAPSTGPDLVGPLGRAAGPGGAAAVFAAPPLGRLRADQLAALGRTIAPHGAPMHVTPWRSIAVPAGDAPAGDAPARADALLDQLAALGLAVDPADPAAGVISCAGAAGCWQSEADALGEARRQIELRRRRGGAVDAGAGVLHVTGCDKRCATRAPVAITLLGRPDGSGFDRVAGP